MQIDCGQSKAGQEDHRLYWVITNTRGLLIRVISLAAHRQIRQPLAVSPRHTAVHAVSPLRVASQRELPPPRLVVPCVASFAVSSPPSPLELHRLFFARLSRRPRSRRHGQECRNSGALAAYSARQADSRRGVPLSSLQRDETRRDEARRDEQPHTHSLNGASSTAHISYKQTGRG